MPNTSIHLLGQAFGKKSLFDKYRELIQSFCKFGEFLSFDDNLSWLSCYEKDAQSLSTKTPLLIFKADSLEIIPSFLKNCCELNLSVTFRGGGTGYVGSCVASSEGVIVLSNQFNKIIDYDCAKGTLIAEPGVTINQINSSSISNEWYFPLEMLTNGVATIAGCICSNSRGYHQQAEDFYDSVKEITIVDGQGVVLNVPGRLLVGSEGLFGMITQVRIQLRKKPSFTVYFQLSLEWDVFHLSFDKLKALELLESCTFYEKAFYLKLSGDKWRYKCIEGYLKEIFPDIIEIDKSVFFKSLMKLTPQPHFLFTTAIKSKILLKGILKANQLAQSLSLLIEIRIDLLANSLLIHLHNQDENSYFEEKIDQFMILWTNFIADEGGIIGNCSGIGIQLMRFMTPFWNEETILSLKKIQKTFDPYQLFNRNRFFPEAGKCLERVRVSCND